MKKKISAVLITLLCVWMLSGCNTIHGMGKDIESGGRAIQKSAEK
jgi:entericidin B